MSFWAIFCPFTTPYPPLMIQKIKILKKNNKKMKKMPQDVILSYIHVYHKDHINYHFTHLYHKWQSYDVSGLMYGSWDMKRDRHNFLSFWTIFCPFTTNSPPSPLMILKIKILKRKMRKMPQDIILSYINVYHKWRSYNIWFLKHKVWQTENLVILGHLLPFQPLDNPKNQIF